MSDFEELKRIVGSKIMYSTLSSKNQITVPSVIREKLDAEPGDQIIFYYNEESKEITVESIKKDSLLSLFGSMPPKEDKRQKDWDVIRKEARDEYLNREKNRGVMNGEYPFRRKYNY